MGSLRRVATIETCTSWLNRRYATDNRWALNPCAKAARLPSTVATRQDFEAENENEDEDDSIVGATNHLGAPQPRSPQPTKPPEFQLTGMN